MKSAKHCERFVRQQNITVTVPEQVAEELGESPGAYEYQRDRLRAGQNAGWLVAGHIDFSVPRVPEVVDKTRARMGALSADDVTYRESNATVRVLPTAVLIQHLHQENEHTNQIKYL